MKYTPGTDFSHQIAKAKRNRAIKWDEHTLKNEDWDLFKCEERQRKIKRLLIIIAIPFLLWGAWQVVTADLCQFWYGISCL